MTPACDDCGGPVIGRRADEARRFLAVAFLADTRVASARAG
jgi:hypothetical protein